MRSRLLAPAVLLGAAVLSVVIASSGPVVLAASPTPVPSVSGVATCHTSATGSCTIPHTLGAVPTAVVPVPLTYPGTAGFSLMLVAGSLTAATFQVRAVRGSTAVGNADIGVQWTAYATAEVVPTTTTTPPTTTTTSPASTTPTVEPTTTTTVPPPAGFPTPSTTGVPAGTVLTAYASPNPVTRDGAVIDGVHVTGDLIIKARNVTVRNTLVDGWIDNESAPADANTTVVDTTVGPASGCNDLPGVGEHDFTALRVLVRGHGDGFRVSGSDVTVRDSFFHACDSVNNHNDGWQAYCPGMVCSNLIVDHNTLDLRGTRNYTAPIFGGDRDGNGQIAKVTITNNLLAGGVFVVFLGYTQGPKIVVTGNRLVDKSGYYGQVSIARGGCGNFTWSDNLNVTVSPTYAVAATVGVQACG